MLLVYNDRIRKLALDLPVDRMQEIEPQLSGVFPILVDVSISVARCDYGARRREDVPEWQPVATPLPSIRYLRLLFVKTPWVLGRFQNLVEFFLHEQPCSDFNPTMEIFLQVLDSSPQLAVLSVANAGPWLPLDTTILPPATRVIRLPNLQRLYLEEDDACDIGWMLTHLEIPASANVRVFLDFSSRIWTIPLELVFDLVFPDHPGFPHLTNIRRCTYAMYCKPSSTITATNFVFTVAWDYDAHTHFDNFMMPFLRRATAAGVIEDLAIFYDMTTEYSASTLRWDEIFGTLSSLRKLQVEQPPHDLDLSIRGLFESPPGPALRDLWLLYLTLEEEGENWEEFAERLVDFCAERDRKGCRLERLVIETVHPPPDLGSLLAPYVDHFEIRKGFLRYHDFSPEFQSVVSERMSRFPRGM